MSKAPILSGKTFFTRSYPGHKWFCIPTIEWIEKNQYSNVGFSFVVDLLDLAYLPDEKTGILKYFYEPKKESLKPIQGTTKIYQNYKKEFMKRNISKKETNKKKGKVATKLKDMEYELKMYKKQVRIMEENVKRMKRKKKDCEYVSEMME